MFIDEYVAMEVEVQTSPASQENGSKIEESPELLNESGPVKSKTRRARSRSKSPQKQKDLKCDFNPKVVLEIIEETLNGQKEQEAKHENTEESPKSSDKDTKEVRRSSRRTKVPDVVETNGQEVAAPSEDEAESQNASVESEQQPQPDTQSDGLNVEMDPLVLETDEPDPELQFDETETDKESGKGSPAQSRCKTRRSHSRQIPTPKTPKSGIEDSESERNAFAATAIAAPPTPVPENLSDSLNTIDDSSIRAQLGSDSSRLDFTADDTYLNYSRERSFSDIVRNLSGRKTIRPIGDSYRLRALRNNLNKNDLNSSDSNDSPDRVRAVKRKRSASPEERKKFKADTGFGSYLSSPLSRIRHSFRADVTGTPTLTAYKDGNQDLRGDASYAEEVTEDDEQDKKTWCALM